MDEELRKIFHESGRKEAPEDFAGRIMSLISAETEKPVCMNTPVIHRTIWYLILLLIMIGLVIVVFFGNNNTDTFRFLTDTLNRFVQNLPAVRIPWHEIPRWPVFLSLISLIVYLSEDYLIRHFIKRDH